MPRKGQIIKKKIKCICEKCGKEFYRYPSAYIPGKTKYCSMSCRASVTMTRINKEILAKDGKSEFICQECGNKFEDYHRKRADRKFCSKICEANSRKNRARVQCEECGKSFEAHVWRLKRGEGRFCSLSCSARWYKGERGKSYGKQQTYEHRKKISEAHRGENHYNWKGGIKSENIKIRKSFEMRDWIYQVFHRDDFTCVHCGQRGYTLHAHHILPFADYPEERFVVDNGITLCVNCHKDSVH